MCCRIYTNLRVENIFTDAIGSPNTAVDAAGSHLRMNSAISTICELKKHAHYEKWSMLRVLMKHKNEA